MTYQVEVYDSKSILFNDGLTHVPTKGSILVIENVKYLVKEVTQVIKKNPMAQEGYSQHNSTFRVKVKKVWWQNANDSKVQGRRPDGRHSGTPLQAVGV